MGNKKLLIIAIAIIGAFVAASLAMAGVADVIPLDTEQYEKHTKGIVQFSHKKHAEEYGAECGDCHHDKEGKPLTGLSLDSPVDKCVACHVETGKISKADKKMKKVEKIRKYHKEALHANCKDCHKKWNKEQGLKKNDPKAAPETCKACHPKVAK
jgi:hypothetical protein